MAKTKKKASNIILTLSFISLAALIFTYVFQVSQVSQASYEIGQTQRQLEGTKKDVAALDASLLKNNTLKNYEQKLGEMGYEKIDRIDYVVVPSAIVAQNR
ncbi:MAG: hypothetical protein WC926_04735 [Candidatus Paceibacterota bacterium]|jgi:hypothetical protein